MRHYETCGLTQFTAILVFAFSLSLWAGCATEEGPQPVRASTAAAESEDTNPRDTTDARSTGSLRVRVLDILDQPLSSRVEIRPSGMSSKRVELPEGSDTVSIAVGPATVLVYVYDNGVPILVDLHEVEVARDETVEIETRLLEGATGNRPLQAFDQDLDLALDGLEVRVGTDPEDPRSEPGGEVIDWPSPVLSEDGAWYGGDLHAYSHHGAGRESVSELIARAERSGLDFLAITDTNSIASGLDPQFRSQEVVLIPGMEWGEEALGYGLVYAPPNLPPVPDSRAEAQALAIKFQAQGAVFGIAHPLLRERPWQWGLQYYNAVEVWNEGWRHLPPLSLTELNERWLERSERGELVYPIAVASATPFLSGNAQATLFYDMEVTRGVKAAVIAGSRSAGPGTPLAEPATFVYAREKSLHGVLEGLRKGRTFVARDLDGPRVEFQVDVFADRKIDVGLGGIIPMNRMSRFVIGIEGAKGARLEVLLNGSPIKTRPIESDRLFYSMEETPEVFAAYRVRIVGPPDSQEGYGYNQVLAMTSPIYAQAYVVDSESAPGDAWIDIENAWQDPASLNDFPQAFIDESNIRTLQPGMPLSPESR